MILRSPLTADNSGSSITVTGSPVLSLKYVESPRRFAIPPVRQIPFSLIPLLTFGGVLSIIVLIARPCAGGHEKTV